MNENEHIFEGSPYGEQVEGSPYAERMERSVTPTYEDANPGALLSESLKNFFRISQQR